MCFNPAWLNFWSLSCFYTMSTSQDLFVSEQHSVSYRWAVVEDDGHVAWLYLTEPNSLKPVIDCWLYNRIETPAQFDSVHGQSPVVPQTHADSGATLQPPDEASVHLRWSRDGESVAVFFDAELIGFIARGQKRDSVGISQLAVRLETCCTWTCFREQYVAMLPVHLFNQYCFAIADRTGSREDRTSPPLHSTKVRPTRLPCRWPKGAVEAWQGNCATRKFQVS